MDIDNVVADIYPAVGTEGHAGAAWSIHMNQKHPGYLPARRRRPQALDLPHQGPPDMLNGRDREPTVDEGEYHPLDYEACIRVTFDQMPKTRFGLRCGRSEDAELTLPDLLTVGFYHFALTFDNEYRLVVRDLGSSRGTTVMYGRREQPRRPTFDWIVGGSDFLEGVSSIIVKVSRFLQFRLIVPRHDVQSKSYRDKVDRFCAGTAHTHHLRLLSRVRTDVPTGLQPPATSIGVMKKIGQGGFAVVYRFWDVGINQQYVLKKPHGPSFDAGAWKREALLMRRMDHKHIVSLLNYCPGPSPWLHLENMPLGSVHDNLEAGLFFAPGECRQIFAQMSDALAYLHSLEPQIVHRDIKPSKILILYRHPDAIFVKFAGFGVPREGIPFETMCSTALYRAPEIYEANGIQGEERTRYTSAADIWSLGVVLVHLRCELPTYEEEQRMGMEWCWKVYWWTDVMLGEGDIVRDDLLLFVFEWMLCPRPARRGTATVCHKEALRLLDLDRTEESDGYSE